MPFGRIAAGTKRHQRQRNGRAAIACGQGLAAGFERRPGKRRNQQTKGRHHNYDARSYCQRAMHFIRLPGEAAGACHPSGRHGA
jgi:hypothetical protein